MTEAKLASINHFFRVHNQSTGHCLEPNELCEAPAIRSHSIPSSSVLAILAEQGHVIMPQFRLKAQAANEYSFKRVGTNKATTFTGLCTRHDNDLFRPIDARLPDLKDSSHLFLLAYRAVLREYHACLQNACRFQSAYRKRVELGLSPGTVRC